MLGARIVPCDADAEVVLPGGEFRERRGLRVHREQLADDEIETVAGAAVTIAVRTAYNLARWSTPVEGVVAADALGRVRPVRIGQAAAAGRSLSRCSGGAAGFVWSLCRVAGHGVSGRPGWRGVRRRAPPGRAGIQVDLARHNRLAALGWTVLRASALDVLRHPDRFAAQVRAVLRQSVPCSVPPDLNR